MAIYKGIRPEIIEGTMPKYVELMKRCWDNDPKKRPTAKREPEPKSCYMSRRLIIQLNLVNLA
ncbi:hypothetical protein C1645_819750 [Glomus cerebriforme]|uniref:Serine-threonine/tyrosine-protein kinase catalytic domain-containing protein n=1 Tax=Glomus cerebriforme TaxID=658196 RepID=A0A397T883_9GLOM|nr:hypothetical protein C1645_819750 [Glomus cerebriforme]